VRIFWAWEITPAGLPMLVEKLDFKELPGFYELMRKDEALARTVAYWITRGICVGSA